MSEEKSMTIAGRKIGTGVPPYIVAEMSANHLGDYDRALRIIDAAAEAGADALKLQTYTADTITIDHDGPGFKIEGGLWDGRTLYGLYEEAFTPWEWHEPLIEHGRDQGLTMISAPFDPTAVTFLDEIGIDAIKIASFECIDTPLVGCAAATGRPLIMSTGMADLGEISDAIAAVRATGNENFVLLHCISGYPTPAAESHLRTIPNLAAAFDCPVGLSDHTMGTAVSTTAIALGACLVEKHFTLARDDGGPDAAFSLEPDELKRLVLDCRTAWDALGHIEYGLKESEAGNAALRRSLYAVEDIPAGAALTDGNCRSIRPGYGLAPKHLPEVLGLKARHDIARGTPIAWDLLEK
jgi:pseudaminic acid synthase